MRSRSGRSLSASADRVRLHDSALPFWIFFKRKRTHSIDTVSYGKVVKLMKKIEGGRGGKQLPAFPHLLMLGMQLSPLILLGGHSGWIVS